MGAEELGLDHFEGRSWSGLHRHALMSMIAFLNLQNRQLDAAKRGKNRIGPPPQPSLPAIRTAIIALFNPGLGVDSLLAQLRADLPFIQPSTV